VVAFLEALGIASAVLVGHSMGTIVAERVAIDHPGRVAGLVLLGGRPEFAGPDVEDVFAAVAGLTDPVDRRTGRAGGAWPPRWSCSSPSARPWRATRAAGGARGRARRAP
jgi:pimeloyl-ACP methyl ester carboxylesterase